MNEQTSEQHLGLEQFTIPHVSSKGDKFYLASEVCALLDHSPAQPDTAALQARIAEADDALYKIRLTADIYEGSCHAYKERIAELEAQLAAQAGQEPAIFVNGDDLLSRQGGNTGDLPVSMLRNNWYKTALYTTPPAPANNPALNETSMMAECMDMVRQDLIDAGIIDKTVPPMMVSDAVASYIRKLRIAIVQACADVCVEMGNDAGVDIATFIRANAGAIIDAATKGQS